MPIDRKKLRTLVKANLLAKPPRMTEDEVQAKYLDLVRQIERLRQSDTQEAVELVTGRPWKKERERLLKLKVALVGTMIRRGITVPNYERSK